MIAEAVRSSSSCSSRTMATTSAADPSKTLSVREDEGDKGGVALPASKPTASPAPPNGELYHEEPLAPAPVPVPVPLPTSPTPPPTSSSSSSSASSLSSAPVSQPCSGEAGPPCLKEEDDFHVSSEDEDKLVINEGCEKKEPLFHQDVKIDPTGPGSSQSELSSESPPKSPLKRPAEDADAVETNLKKLRVQEDTETFVPASLAQVEESIAILKSDLKGLEVLLAQKEEEWNSLLMLFKKKEESYIRLLRKKQVLKMGGGAVKKDDEEEEEDEGVMFLPQGAYSSLGSSQFPLMMMKHMLGESYVPQVLPSHHKLPESKYPSSSNGPLTSQNNISVIDIHTSNSKSGGYSEPPQISISPETHSKLGKQLNSMMPVKPILPKPSGCGGGMVNPNVPFPPLPYPATGYGPQGPTVSVHHLIAAHRKENPHIPPMRGAKRGAWRHRYDADKRSSSREPDRPSSVSSSNSETDVRLNASLNSKGSSISSPAPNNMLPMNDPSVSYKDVLLQFAQLTQTEKQPGSPQISIIPVSASDSSNKKTEPIPDSTSASISKEHSGTPHPPAQSSNLEGSALVKLLLESGAGSHGKSSAVDLSPYNNSSPHSVTLSALLSGGTTTTLKDKSASSSQMDSRSKKNSAEEVTTNPKCQGCHNQRAQFVCAGCGNQWYCSRSCQVTAWERHSEHCNS